MSCLDMNPVMPGPTGAWYSPRGKSAPGLITSRLATKWRPAEAMQFRLPANMLICFDRRGAIGAVGSGGLLCAPSPELVRSWLLPPCVTEAFDQRRQRCCLPLLIGLRCDRFPAYRSQSARGRCSSCIFVYTSGRCLRNRHRSRAVFLIDVRTV